MVYGAGVLGSYLAHVLSGADRQVTLLARGSRAETLRRDGLVIRHYLQRETTVDHPQITERLDPAEHYDVIFSVMQHQQQWTVLPELAAADCPLVVLIGNNLSAPEMERRILQSAAAPKTVLFGFQSTGGRRENGLVQCVRTGDGKMSVGMAHGDAPGAVRAALEAAFAGTRYELSWQPDMDGWYKCHAAFILPVAYLCYATGCDLRQSTRAQRRLLMDAAGEAFDLLEELHTPILPSGEAEYYRPGPRRVLLTLMIWAMAKTVVGDLAASDHCRHAVEEMQGMDAAFDALRASNGGRPMPAFDRLRASMPVWEILQLQYEGGKKK